MIKVISYNDLGKITIRHIKDEELFKALIEEINMTIKTYENTKNICLKCHKKFVGYGNICNKCFKEEKKVSQK